MWDTRGLRGFIRDLTRVSRRASGRRNFQAFQCFLVGFDGIRRVFREPQQISGELQVVFRRF